MQFDRYSAGNDDADRRLDRIARRFLPETPLSSIYRLIRKGFIRVDGKRASPDLQVAVGSEIWVARLPEIEPSKAVPAPTPPSKHVADADDVKILLECDDLLIVDKPAGRAVHGEGGLDSLVPQSAAARESLSFRSGPLHRLDRGTSGILVFSKTLHGARWFSERIAAHICDKIYLGIVVGHLEGSKEWYDESTDGKRMITFADPIVTNGSGPARTLVRFRIVTGRKHQIRFQSAKHGFPLEGDLRYNHTARPGGNGYFLHAWRLAFGPGERPAGLPDAIVASPPKGFQRRVRELFGDGALARLEY